MLPVMRARLPNARVIVIAAALGIASELGTVGAGILWAGSADPALGHGEVVCSGYPASFTRAETTLVTTIYISWGFTNAAVTPADRAPLPGWSFAWRPPGAFRTASDSAPQHIELAYGWPWRSAHALLARDHFLPHSPTNPRAVSGIRLADRRLWTPKYTLWLSRALPTVPIWPGLLAGSAAFASAWGASILGVGAMRRWSRRRRGCCVRCAYDLSATPPGAPCPECGTPAPSAPPPS